MSDIIDSNYFYELSKASPETLCTDGRAHYHTASQTYSLEIWGTEYRFDCIKAELEKNILTPPPPHQYFDLLAIYYLLLGKTFSLKGTWVSEKDLPGGTTFFRGPHLVPTDLITGHFNNDLQKFKNCCELLGGTPLMMADAAYRFSITNDIAVAVLYWIGDEDFPAEAKLLYDESISEILSLDILFALAVGVCDRIASAVP